MRTVPTSARAWAPRPLSPEEGALAEQVAGRLHAELRRLIRGLPEHARHASGMSRHLGVLRATCQRVTQAIQEHGASVSLLGKLPGVEGLRQFVTALRTAGADAADVASGESAVDAFERLIQSAAGSQTKLLERLSLSVTAVGQPEAGVGMTPERENLFRAAARVAGRSCEVSLSVYAFRVSENDPTVLERALAKGLIGSRQVPGGMPVVLSSGNTLATGNEADQATTLDRGVGVRGRTPEAILRAFTTDPLPIVTSRGRGGTLFQVIDERTGASGVPIDVVTALRASAPVLDPQSGKPTLDAVWSLVSCPSERLILDVYLHEEMERRYRPSIEALLWAPDLNVPHENRWAQRVPCQPRLQLLGRGTVLSASPFYPRHAELTEYFFHHIGWDADGFIGFRCEVEYPVWRAGYCMSFEHLETPAASAE